MNAAAIAKGLELASLLFNLGAAALERSDNATALKIVGLGRAITGAVAATGRIDEAIAADVRAMAQELDKAGNPDRAAWEGIAGKVRSAADRWNAAG